MFINIGPLDRKLRIIIGFTLIALGLIAPLPELWHMATMSIGIVALFPALFGFCLFKAWCFATWANRLDAPGHGSRCRVLEPT